MTVERVQESDYQKVIHDAWGSDDDLINKYHIRAGEGHEVCVSDTLRVLRDNVDKTTFHLHKVKDGKNDIGFFGSEMLNGKPFLTTFFINPKHRNKDVKGKFINLVGETIGREFMTALYIKNDRAVNWFVRLGAEYIDMYRGEKGDVVVMNLKL